MPRKVREVVGDLLRAGFVIKGGKGGHRKFVHQNVARPVVISGNDGNDAKHYQEKSARLAIEESTK